MLRHHKSTRNYTHASSTDTQRDKYTHKLSRSIIACSYRLPQIRSDLAPCTVTPVIWPRNNRNRSDVLLQSLLHARLFACSRCAANSEKYRLKLPDRREITGAWCWGPFASGANSERFDPYVHRVSVHRGEKFRCILEKCPTVVGGMKPLLSDVGAW